jgi:hypothetical protein
MARARNIKPSLFKNELLGVADPILTILFEGLWCLADREGRLEDRPLRIKAEVFPYRENLDVNRYLTELSRMGFIERYVESGEAVIQVVKFKKHQTPHNTEKKSDLPARTDNSLIIRDFESLTVKSPLSDDGLTAALPPDSLNLIPDSPTTDSGIPLPPQTEPRADAPRIRQQPRGPADDEKFAEAWAAYPKRPGASRADAHKAWSARVKEKVDPDLIIAGVHRYADHVARSGTEPQFIKQPATFFGPGKHYEADWGPAQPQGAPQLGKAGQATARAAEEWLRGRGNA